MIARSQQQQRRDPGRMLTREEAAEMLGVKPGTLAQWHSTKREPRPPVCIVGTRTIRYSEVDLEEFIFQQTSR